jgi:hypothetical protein
MVIAHVNSCTIAIQQLQKFAIKMVYEIPLCDKRLAKVKEHTRRIICHSKPIYFLWQPFLILPFWASNTLNSVLAFSASK